MTRLVTIRLVLIVIAVALWGYGYRTDSADIRLAAIILMVIALVLRFLPRRWFGEAPKRED